MVSKKYNDTNICATNPLLNGFLIQQHLEPTRNEQRLKGKEFLMRRGGPRFQRENTVDKEEIKKFKDMRWKY
jgi:hypothetical protein